MNEEESMEQRALEESARRTAYLIAGYIKETLTEKEHEELDGWVTASMENQKLFERMTDPDFLEKSIREKEGSPTAETLEKIKTRMVFTPERRSSKTMQLWPWLLAAAVLSAVITTIFLVIKHNDSGQPPAIAKQKDISPGGIHASLRLSDGTTLLLDTLKNGALHEGMDQIRKGEGIIQYATEKTNANHNAAVVSYNELTTPPGGEFKIILNDGTMVLLNAGSTIKYPVRFTEGWRKVELSGEAYFEVAKDAAHPFIVETGQAQVEVLGTHFNINAYSEQEQTLVTLAEGSVNLNHREVLKPGEQAVVNSSGEIKTALVDLEPVLAWTKDEFLFRQTPISTVLDQLSHWYDAKIVYQDHITEHFNASIPRNVPVSKVLHLLESTGSVRFKIEDKTITVMR